MKVKQEFWNKIKEQFGYPNVSYPIIEDKKHTAYINMVSKDIVISKPFLDKLNMGYGKAIKGILEHEINHYVTLPYDLKTSNYMFDLVKLKTNEDINMICNYFSDVVINLDLHKRELNDIFEVYSNMSSESVLDNTLKELYKRKTSFKINVFEEKIDEEALLKLLKIDYLNKKLLEKNLLEFTDIIKNIISKKDKLKIDEIKYGSSKNKASSAPFDDETLPKLGLRELKADYEKLAHALQVKLTTPSFSKIDTVKDFQVSSKISEYNPFKSNCKFLPNISKINTGVDYEFQKIKKDLFLAIDSSASIPNPLKKINPYMIASLVIAKNYMAQNQSKVSVLNFSEESILTEFTENYEKIRDALFLYQAQKTKIDLNYYTKEKVRDADIFLLTDMQVQNFPVVLNHLQKLQNKTYILCFNGENTYSYKDNISIFTLEDEFKIIDVAKKISGGLNNGYKVI